MNESRPPKSPDVPSVLANDVIDRIYEVAVDPTRYEQLLDQWEQLIGPYRRDAGMTHPISLGTFDFESHFRRASQVLDNLDPNRSNSNPDTVLANFSNSAAFTIDRNLLISDVNEPARHGLGLHPGAPLSQLAIGADDEEALAEQVKRLLDSNADIPVMFRARVTDQPRLIVLQLRAMRPENSVPYVVAATSELVWPDGFNAFLKSVFDLTEAEAEVLRALSECHNLKEIADIRGRSIETVRAQIKSLQAKTETHSQAELVRLTLSTMEMASFSQSAAAAGVALSEGYDTLQPRPFHTITTAAGRRFDHLVLGNPNGRPCVFLPIDYGLVRWPAQAEAEAYRRGIKVIVPIRPGYGDSTALRRNESVSKAVISDLVELLDHYAIKRCPIISLGSDFFFSAHFYTSHPDRTNALIACAGTLPLTRKEQYERMDKWHRFILAGARYTPHLLPFMVKAGFALARKLGKKGFVHAVYGNSAADVETFEISENFEAMTVGSEVALSDIHSAHAAFSAEVIEQETCDWRPQVENLRDKVPVHFLNGLQDPQVPSATLEEHRADYPWIDFRVYPDAGQLLFFKKWRDVMDLLETYL